MNSLLFDVPGSFTTTGDRCPWADLLINSLLFDIQEACVVELRDAVAERVLPIWGPWVDLRIKSLLFEVPGSIYVLILYC